MTPEVELINTSPSRSQKANLEGRTKKPFSWLAQKTDAFAYLILNKEGVIIAASELENPYQKTSFVPSETDTKGLSFAYLVFKGVHEKPDDSIEPIQFIFMRRMYNASQGSMHYRLTEVAIEIFNIEDLCSAFNITLEKNERGQLESYFTGEGEIQKRVQSLTSLLYNTLEGLIFNTRGTQTARFKKADGPMLISFIPACCMVFLKKPLMNAAGIDYDDFLLERISMPGQIESATIQGDINDNSSGNRQLSFEALTAPETGSTITSQNMTLIAPEAEAAQSSVSLKQEDTTEKRPKFAAALLRQSQLYSLTSCDYKENTTDDQEQKLQLN